MALASVWGVLTEVGGYWQSVPSPIHLRLLPPSAVQCMNPTNVPISAESYQLVLPQTTSADFATVPLGCNIFRRMDVNRRSSRRAPPPRSMAPERLFQILRLQVDE